jgi:hypothetical protein
MMLVHFNCFSQCVHSIFIAYVIPPTSVLAKFLFYNISPQKYHVCSFCLFCIFCLSYIITIFQRNSVSLSAALITSPFILPWPLHYSCISIFYDVLADVMHLSIVTGVLQADMTSCAYIIFCTCLTLSSFHIVGGHWLCRLSSSDSS